MAVTNVIGKQIVDLTSDANYYFEVAPQGDSQSRFVDVTVLDNGTPYTIPGASTIILEGKNAGGYNIFNSCTQEDANVIRIPLTNGVLSFAGVGKYSVAIYSSGTYIISFPFNIIVTEAPYDILAVEASDSYEALNEVIAKAADSNRWIVEDNAPPTVCASGVHKNDLFLNALTGDVYYADTNTSTGVLNWYPLMNTATGRQLNIMEKLYIRYADDDVGTNMSIEPIVGGVGKPYIGFYATVNAATSSDVSTASNYKWSLMRNSIDPATSITYYAQTSTTTPPASTIYRLLLERVPIGDTVKEWHQDMETGLQRATVFTETLDDICRLLRHYHRRLDNGDDDNKRHHAKEYQSSTHFCPPLNLLIF